MRSLCNKLRFRQQKRFCMSLNVVSPIKWGSRKEEGGLLPRTLISQPVLGWHVKHMVLCQPHCAQGLLHRELASWSRALCVA